MVKRVFITIDNVYPDDSGGKKLSLGRIMHARDNGDSVFVIHYNYSNQNIDSAKAFFHENGISYTCYNPVSDRTNIISRTFYIIRAFFHNEAEPYFFVRKDKAFNNFISEFIKNNAITDVSIESIFLFSVYKILLCDGCKINITFHNVESEFFMQLSNTAQGMLKKLYYKREGKVIRKLEHKILSCKKNSLLKYTFLTPPDSKFYIDKYDLSEGEYSLNINDIYVNSKIERTVNTEKPFFLFPGSLDFPPNNYSLKKLLHSFDQKIFNEMIPIVVTGKCSEKNKKIFSKYNSLKIVGYVNDAELKKLYSTCVACISPITVGGGVKIKNIETIKLGVPLIATKFSCIGINTEGKKVYLSDDSPSSFVSAMKNFLEITI
ncbi:glycosyltransferase [Xenorhabdus doucetiae]|uniref:Glycosyl transferase family 1 n=1 Tax=Xenorhabdus doucetiae TaxID=351671 RepID=A0A068QPY3_9GAMM|nr:glycosyltransferase [Xenorhabdus doucetiae]TYP07805.1 glycosyl transferase family 1 [Xenorhabdus doucetiae]CDG15880.1 putative mannosyltransferase [Xenorhabdus doucetiae]